MADPYQLVPVGFEIGTDSIGHYLRLRLRNDQPHTYSITRRRFETEGVYSDNSNFGPVEVAPSSSKLVRFDVHDFHDIAFWVSGRRDSVKRNPLMHLATFVADWAPAFPWQSSGCKLSAAPAPSRNKKCKALLDRLLTIEGAIWRERERSRLWPVRATSGGQWEFYVATATIKSSLYTGPYFRISGEKIERFCGGAEGMGWYNVQNCKPTKSQGSDR